MKKDIAMAWVEYLREPDRIQAHGMLGHPRDGSRCCLGHLCDLAVTEGVIKKPVSDFEGINLMYGSQGNKGSLPYEVTVWAGIESDVAQSRFGDEAVTWPASMSREGQTRSGYHNVGKNPSLVRLNDSMKGINLSQIADFIELNYENL